MKQMRLFGGISGIALVFVMVLAGCEQAYNGPSIDEISDAVISKQPKPPIPPTPDEIAESVMDRQDVASNSRWLKDKLESLGRLTVTRDIQAWGQTDAAYTLTVNTAERASFNLDDSSVLTWSGNGNDDIRRSGNVITLAEKSNGKRADFGFTITDTIDQTKTIKGTLTVSTNYDNSTLGTANINVFFKKVLSRKKDDNDNKTITVNIPIDRWGQTDVAYTIDAENEVYVYFSTSEAPVLYNRDTKEWDIALVEWKPPVVASGLAYEIRYYKPADEDINGDKFTFDRSYFRLFRDTADGKAELNFRITYGDQSISGKITVNIKQVDTELSPAEKEKMALEKLRSDFDAAFEPLVYYDLSAAAVLTRFIDKGITAFGQTDVLYFITVRGGGKTGDDDGNYYAPLPLPIMKDNEGENFVDWAATGVTSNAVVLDKTFDPVLNVYENRSGTADFSFTYTYSPGKTVKGKVSVVVLKSLPQ